MFYEIIVEKAMQLPSLSMFGKVDPYVVVFYPVHSNFPTHTTKVVKNSENPTFGDKVSIRRNPADTNVRLVVYDSDMVSDKYIGEVTVSLLEPISGVSLELVDKTKTPPVRGRGFLQVSLRDNTPPQYTLQSNGILGMTPGFPTTLHHPQQSLPVFTTPQQQQQYLPAQPLAPSTQDWGNLPQPIGAAVGNIFTKYEIPMGMIQRLNSLSGINVIEVIVDDSGSMASQTDARDFETRGTMTRWQEVLQRLKMMTELIAYVQPRPPTMFIRFLNRSTVLEFTMGDDEPLPSFIDRCKGQLLSVFSSGPSGGTPALARIQESMSRYDHSLRVMRYFFGDGAPEGGQMTRTEIISMLIYRPSPENSPFTFISCTNDDVATEWMKEAEEAAPYVAEYDDFDDEASEVHLDQGRAIPFSFGMYLVCQIVGVLYPEDLDALDESVPITKAALDSLLGYVLSPQEYDYYFDEFITTQKRRKPNCEVSKLKARYLEEWILNRSQFSEVKSSYAIPAVQSYLHSLRSIAPYCKHTS